MLKPEFLQAPERRLIALAREFSLDTRMEIPALWSEFWSREWDLEGEEEAVCYGASYGMQLDGQFTYAVGVNIEPLPETRPEDTCVVTLSAGRYAVFRQQGPVQEIPALFDSIFGSWLPESGETQREGAVFERYPYVEGCSPESMLYEIWVPVTG